MVTALFVVRVAALWPVRSCVMFFTLSECVRARPSSRWIHHPARRASTIVSPQGRDHLLANLIAFAAALMRPAVASPIRPRSYQIILGHG
jgi:hypothetical protein